MDSTSVLLNKAQDLIQDAMIQVKGGGLDAQILASFILGQIAELELLLAQNVSHRLRSATSASPITSPAPVTLDESAKSSASSRDN